MLEEEVELAVREYESMFKPPVRDEQHRGYEPEAESDDEDEA